MQKNLGKRAISFVGCGVVIGAFLIAVMGFVRILALPHESRFMIDRMWPWFASAASTSISRGGSTRSR